VTACQSGGVGDPCIPEDEYRPEFPGFASNGVHVESRSMQCETRVCLVNNFQGRVSCPYGQDHESRDDGTPSPVDHEQECEVPGSDRSVEAVVRPQIVERRAERAVYCSCRCDGDDPDAPYCECPGGFECRPLMPDVGPALGTQQLAGSYCVRAGTYVAPGDVYDRAACEWDDVTGGPKPGSEDCGPLVGSY